MARDIPVGNGSLLVNFDGQYHIRDIYFPHVGDENHTDGHPFKLGVWVDGGFSWVHDGWQITREYEEETLATHVLLENENLGLSLLCRDVVDFHGDDFLVRQFVLRNAREIERQVRLFFHHDFHISETEVGDTLLRPHHPSLDPLQGAALVPCQCLPVNRVSRTRPVAVGRKETSAREGTWRDAEDGLLSGNPVAQGAVDSVGAVHCTPPPSGEATVYVWMAAGTDYAQVRLLDSSPARRGQKRCCTVPSATGACG